MESLREENDRLQRQVATLQAKLEHIERVDAERQATFAALLEQLEVLKEQNALLRKALYSNRRERYVPSPDQKLLFEPESLSGPGADESDVDKPAADSSPALEGPGELMTAAPVERKPRKARRKRFLFPECLETKRVEYRLTDEELTALYGPGPWKVVKEVTTKRLEITPASAYVVEQVRFEYARVENEDGGPLVVVTEKPASINDKGIFGPAAVAYVSEAKFGRHLPFYRLQQELHTASTLWFSRSVLSGCVLRAADGVLPLWDLMAYSVLDSFYLRVDETTVRVLRPGTGSAEQVYMWAYVGDQRHPYQIIDYQLDRSRAGPAAMLANFSGGLLTDGYSVYSSLVDASNGRLVDLGCWAHARRKFDESCALTANPLAHQALAWIGQLYDLEDQFAEATVEARYDARQRIAVPILNRLKERLLEEQPKARPTSKLYEAIGYLLNRWDAMTRYVADGRYAIDNNAAERALRSCVLGRRNYLFFGSDDGGRAGSVLYTLVQSARANNVCVLPYLTDVFVRVPMIVPEYLRIGDAPTPFDALTSGQRDALAELLPDRWLAAHPEHRAEDRQRELDEANQQRRRRRTRRRPAVKA